MQDQRLHIAVAVIFNREQDRVLLSKRPKHVHQGGLWEFPGGKCRDKEDIQVALRRELEEELGLHVERAESFMKIEHDYPDLQVLLDVWCVYEWNGVISGREGQHIEWVKLDRLQQKEFPAANTPIVKAIQDPA